jgi:tight adherence protein C
MGFAIVTFLAIFLLITSGGLLLFYRQAMVQRIASVISPQSKRDNLLQSIQQKNISLSTVVEPLERFLPRSKEETTATQHRLIQAGYRKESAAKMYYGAKVALPLCLCALLLITGIGKHNPFFLFVLAIAIGYLVPDFWLGRRIAKRQAEISRGLPDALDLLVICIEAGLGLDQATARTSEELGMAHPALGDELGVVVLEQRAGRPRADAWKNLGDRTGVDSVRNLVSVLVQSEKFGTSIGKTLRVHSDTLRSQRRQKVEEMAAKTTVKLVFPLVFFIFPSLFVVTIGPAAIIMMESFHKYLTH